MTFDKVLKYYRKGYKIKRKDWAGDKPYWQKDLKGLIILKLEDMDATDWEVL